MLQLCATAVKDNPSSVTSSSFEFAILCCLLCCSPFTPTSRRRALILHPSQNFAPATSGSAGANWGDGLMMLRHSLLLSTAVLIARLGGLAALDNGLARTPHMGYNTWNCFGGDSRCQIRYAPVIRALVIRPHIWSDCLCSQRGHHQIHCRHHDTDRVEQGWIRVPCD